MMQTDKINRRTFTKSAAVTIVAAAGGLAGMQTPESSDARANDAVRRRQMKFAICNELFEAWNTDRGFDFPRMFEYVQKVGYDGVEVAPFTIDKNAFHIPASQRAEIRRQAERSGIEIPGLHWLLAKTEGFHLTSPDPAVRRKTSDYFIELVRLCADLGGKYMVLGSPPQRNLPPGVTLDQGMDHAAQVLSRVVPVLEKYKVCIALEPLSREATDFLQNAAEAVRLIEKIGAPKQIALILDTRAMSDEAVPIPDLIRQHRKHLVYFHANDPNRQGPGFGELRFEPILQALAEIDYDGWVSVEVFDYKPGIEALAEKSLAYLQECLRKTTQRGWYRNRASAR